MRHQAKCVLNQAEMHKKAPHDYQGCKERQRVKDQRQVRMEWSSGRRCQQKRIKDGRSGRCMQSRSHSIVAMTYLVAQRKLDIGVIQGINEHALIKPEDRDEETEHDRRSYDQGHGKGDGTNESTALIFRRGGHGGRELNRAFEHLRKPVIFSLRPEHPWNSLNRAGTQTAYVASDSGVQFRQNSNQFALSLGGDGLVSEQTYALFTAGRHDSVRYQRMLLHPRMCDTAFPVGGRALHGRAGCPIFRAFLKLEWCALRDSNSRPSGS